MLGRVALIAIIPAGQPHLLFTLFNATCLPIAWRNILKKGVVLLGADMVIVPLVLNFTTNARFVRL